MSSRPVHRTFRIAAAGLALAMLAAACDSDDGATPASSSGGEDTLASFMGWEDEDVDDAEMQSQWRDREAEIQESIRACMAEEGFEYIPVDHSSGSMSVDEEWDEEEWARTQGFGITTWYGSDEAMGVVEEDYEETPDPNWEIVEAMSEGEQQAYYEALYGSDEEQREDATIEYDEETGEEIGWSSSGFGAGCDGQAYEEAHGGGAGQELWEELQPAFDELYARVEADPRIVEWNEEWSKCMAEAGHDYPSQQAMGEQVHEEFQERLDAILGPDGGYIDPFDGWSEADVDAFFAEKTEDEIDAFFRENDGMSLDDADQAALESLQQEEIALALTDLECRDGDAYWELYQEVSESYEAAFIAENRELLEQIRESEGG